jgi:hypothetical protein
MCPFHEAQYAGMQVDNAFTVLGSLLYTTAMSIAVRQRLANCLAMQIEEIGLDLELEA